MPIVRQLAFKNANRYFQEAVCPHKNKSLNEYLKFCRDIYGHHIMRQVIALVVRGPMGNSGVPPKTCFKCSQTSHFKRDCSKSLVSFSHMVPGLCPRCKKESHWTNKYRSKVDTQGNPLPVVLGNGKWGLLCLPPLGRCTGTWICLWPSLSSSSPKKPLHVQDIVSMTL